MLAFIVTLTPEKGLTLCGLNVTEMVQKLLGPTDVIDEQPLLLTPKFAVSLMAMLESCSAALPVL